MDRRTELKAGTVLDFPGMRCAVEACVGRGSNALVYEGAYQDATHVEQRHRVLIKELFPYDPQGYIRRDETGAVRHDGEGEALWRMHRLSFERGNEIHLKLLSLSPDQLGGNLNTFQLNGTLYTLLDYSGGRSLEAELRRKHSFSLQAAATRTLMLLFSLKHFHQHGYLHLDISLDNVLLVSSEGWERIMLIDYNSVHTREELLRRENIYFSAKKGFTAPEALAGQPEDIGPWTDLFSVTAVFYAMLTGKPPTDIQLVRRGPPPVENNPSFEDATSTVREQVRRILRRGLNALPDKRYASCQAMIRDIQELLNRLDGVGVTHAALWEAGRRNALRLVRQNPSLDYVLREADLYPLRVRMADGTSVTAEQFMAGRASSILLGEGGMGKSTALLRAALTGPSRYSPADPAVLYIPLLGMASHGACAILDRVLTELRFDTATRTMEDARHALLSLLDGAREGRVLLTLLLDGLNEFTGDLAVLLREIRTLSKLPGLRIVIASRTAPEGLDLPHAVMIPLEEKDVGDTLSKNGLLMPESDAMRLLLRTPMMLSMFVGTARALETQVTCQTERELLDGYLDALCRKAARDVDQTLAYQTEAAVRLVLPAIAREIARQGGPLNDEALLPAVSRCRRALKSRALVRAFPEWIGQGGRIAGEGAAETWYGQMTQEILWRRLGLLVRDEAGRYHVPHQILQEHLLERERENAARLRSRRIRQGAFTACLTLLAAAMALAGYELWLKPKPYPENQCAAVMDAALIQYVNAGAQYADMKDMLAGATSPDMAAMSVWQEQTPATRSAALSLARMREGEGEVAPWSGRAVDLDHAETMMTLSTDRAGEYAAYATAYGLILSGETSTDRDAFVRALDTLLEADADAAWVMYRAVCEPHEQTMDDAHRAVYEELKLSLPPAQETRSVDVSGGLAYALDKALEVRREAARTLSGMAVIHDPRVQAALSATAPVLTIAPSASAGPTEALLNQIAALLDIRESMYTAEDAALSAVEAFDERRDYVSLTQARIAYGGMKQASVGFADPAFTLTDEELQALTDRGVEIDALETYLYDALQNELQWNVTPNRWLSMLYADVYLASQTPTLHGWLEADRQVLRLNAENDLLMVNYLLVPLADEPDVQAFWAGIPERWPLIGASQPAWQSDQEELMRATQANMEARESVLDQAMDTLGLSVFTLDNLTAVVDEASLDSLRADKASLAGMPIALPLPLESFSLDDGDVSCSPAETADAALPSLLMLSDNHFPLTAYNAYVDWLVDFGCTLYRRDGSDTEGWSTTLIAGAGLVIVKWTPEERCLIGFDPSLLTVESMLYLLN